MSFLNLITDPGALLLPELENTHEQLLLILTSSMGVIATGLFVLGVKKYYYDDSRQGILFIGTGVVLGSVVFAVIKSV